MYEVLGERREATTNAAGRARIDALATGFASAAVKDVSFRHACVSSATRERYDGRGRPCV